MTPTQLIFKMSWDSKRPASSDFTLGKRKKYAGVISSECGGWGIVWASFNTRDSWTEVAE
jgi:hypothetical protein